MRRLLKVVLWGVLGLFALVVVVGLLAPAPPSSGPEEVAEEQNQPAPKPAPQQNPKPEPKPAPPPEPQAKPDDYLRVSGTTKTASCSVLDDDSQRSIDTPVPATIKLNVGWAGVASVSCQKRSMDDSSLRLELVVNGETKAGTTTAQAGVVSLTAP